MDFIILDGADIKVFVVYGFYYFRWGGYINLKSKYTWILNFHIKKSRYKNFELKTISFKYYCHTFMSLITFSTFSTLVNQQV